VVAVDTPLDRLRLREVKAMSHLVRVLNQKITSRSFDFRAGEIACYLGSLAVLVLGILRLLAMEMTEAERFIGLFGVIAVFLLCVILGVLLKHSPAIQSRAG
jgi:cadmium resistance protein CadD (predicted permease)